jgi:RNA polymerase sigma-70 factor, ECF subfamily
VDRDLVERAQHGDREAFAILAGAWIARLRHLAQLMLNYPDLADDAVQEALVVAWRDLRGLRDPDRFGAWLHRILVRSVLREARRERRALGLTVPFDDVTLAAPTGSDLIADRDEIDRGFRRLKAEHRAVLVLHHYLGLSDDETAEVLHVPPGTVRSRLNRATAAMRAALEADARQTARIVGMGTLR